MTGGVKVTVWRSKRTPPANPAKATATLHTLRFFHDDGKEKKKVVLSVSSLCVKDALDRDRERKEKVKDGDGGGDGEENCRTLKKEKKNINISTV